MSVLTFINLIANVTIAAALLIFILRAFGNHKSPIWKNNTLAWVSKTGLCLTFCGCISNILTVQIPTLTTVAIHVGLSLSFCWLTRFGIEDLCGKEHKKTVKSNNRKNTKPRNLYEYK